MSSLPERGDLVVALRDGVRCPQGFPLQVPEQGKIYRINGVYRMWYGLGCTLEGLNPRPYRGYYLMVDTNRIAGGLVKLPEPIIYFRKVIQDGALDSLLESRSMPNWLKTTPSIPTRVEETC